MPVSFITKPQPTVDELVALLRKSSLPTVVCEGEDDVVIYRRLEERLGHLGVSVLPAGGRRNVLELFARWSELQPALAVAFIADLDVWVNVGVPVTYQAPNLFFTDGYSIENDAICDGQFENLLVGTEVVQYRAELHDFVRWYALALTRHIADPTKPISLHPHQVLDPQNLPSLLALEPGESYPTTMMDILITNHRRLVRGKSLLGLILKNTNGRGGHPRHNDRSLLETVAARPGPLLIRLTNQIERFFVDGGEGSLLPSAP